MRFWSGPGAPKTLHVQVSPNHFGSCFRPKFEKMAFKKHPNIDAEKVSKIQAKRLPYQNGCQNLGNPIIFLKRRKYTKLFVLQYKTWFRALENT